MKVEYQPRARKNENAILSMIGRVGGDEVAKRMETSESTVSRLKNGDLAQFASFLACLGLKVVPETMKCYDEKKIGAVFELAKDRMERMRSIADLEDDPE